MPNAAFEFKCQKRQTIRALGAPNHTNRVYAPNSNDVCVCVCVCVCVFLIYVYKQAEVNARTAAESAAPPRCRDGNTGIRIKTCPRVEKATLIPASLILRFEPDLSRGVARDADPRNLTKTFCHLPSRPSYLKFKLEM
ncbi:hypothetical protein EVAR_30373_1 [Eumeta japonica]|uniref:Uncharacterized protein n=1 Tax=Eumeta variegata TaxID=151549 RepID=A0A4C1W7U6_EUMVA|nr:hypothetical protein EVAR_30373_1 [Eumeta japonica]